MAAIFPSFDLAFFDWVVLAAGGTMIGLTKTGFSGASIVVLPFFTAIFGGKTAAGIMLPLLLAGDVLGVAYYHRHADWKRLSRLLPWALAGIAIGIVVGRYVSDLWFRRLIGIFVLAGLAFTAYRDLAGDAFPLTDRWWIRALIGLVGGVVTMIGNAGGTFMAVYFLLSGLEKENYIGTNLWFIFILNMVKVPLQLLFWDSITRETALLDLFLLPSVLLGFVLGLSLMKRLSPRVFRVVIMILSALASARLLA